MLRNGLDDKLLLVAVLLILIGVLFYFEAHGSVDGVAWTRTEIATVVGGLLLLVTGGAKISSGNNSVIATNTENTSEKVEPHPDK